MKAARPAPCQASIDVYKKAASAALIAGIAWSMTPSPAAADSPPAAGGARENRTFSTVATTPLAVEGLTGDQRGNLYTTGRNPGNGQPCPVWRVTPGSTALTVVGTIPAPGPDAQCSPSGIAFDARGDLFVSDGDRIHTFTPDAARPPTATAYASGVRGTNGLAFDRAGNLWTGDGTTGQGRVWKVAPGGAVTEMFRIQPMANEVNLVNGVGGVGRDVRTLPGGTITVTPTGRAAADTAASQPLVANGLAFDSTGNLLVADTARGAIWKVAFDTQGAVKSPMGCDTTFAPNTLCLDSILVAHPLLDGADGIVLDVADNIIASVNERNALVAVSKRGEVQEIFRNLPDPGTRLRNAGPLEFPTSPFLLGTQLCTANADSGRRDNAPPAAGELGGPGQPKAKISCMDQPWRQPGARLPV